MALENYNILKCMSRKELLELVPKEFSFYTSPWDHQIASFLSCIANLSFLPALDLGTGKTKVAIDVCRYVKMVLGERVSGIVVCTSNAVEKWVEEIETHSCELIGLPALGKDRLDLICNTHYDLRVIAFESLRAACTSRVSIPGEKKNREVIDPDKLKRIFASAPHTLIIDESHKIKNKDSLIYNICELISRRVKYKWLLTGTPFNKLIDLWTQYFIMDRGETFGKSFYKFRRENFKPVEKYFKRKGIAITDYKLTEDGKKNIQSKMYTRAIRYSEDEVKGMPGKVFEKIEYELSKDQEKDYLKFLNQVQIDESIYGHSKTMLYRQICSGFILRTKKRYNTNPKLNALMEALEPIIEESKVVIFHVFIEEYNIISEALNKAKIKFCALNGAVKDKFQQNKLFLDDPKYRVMVANLKSGAEAIDLQSARYTFFFSNDHSIIVRKQAIKRTHRGDIKRTRFYYDMVGKHTVENSMYYAMKAGVSLFDETMDGQAFRDAMLGKRNKRQ